MCITMMAIARGAIYAPDPTKCQINSRRIYWPHDARQQQRTARTHKQAI